MKKYVLIIFLCLMLFLTACNNEASNIVKEPENNVEEIKSISLLVVNWGKDITYNIEYSGELTPEVLAKGLSDLTGLDFIISSTKGEEGIYIDWDKKSTLIANLGDKEQKEEFHFYDADSMRWFMMDNLAKAVKDNLNVDNVYYTMDGGKELQFEELYPINIFPSDIPYAGSEFFFSQPDGRGDLIEDEGVNEWVGAYVNRELGFSIEIEEFEGQDFWFDVYLLRDGHQVLGGTASISEDDDHLAMMDDIGIYLYEDLSAIDFLAPESSEWEHLRGQYTKLVEE